MSATIVSLTQVTLHPSPVVNVGGIDRYKKRSGVAPRPVYVCYAAQSNFDLHRVRVKFLLMTSKKN